MPLPIILASVGQVVLGKVVKAAVARAVETVADDRSVPGVKKTDVVPVAAAVIMALGADKQFINATNSEPPIQSRIVWGAVIAALGVVVPPLARLIGLDVDGAYIVEFGGAVITLASLGFVLYGRLVKGLRPMFSRGAS